jgi:hypothetical protein
MAQDPDDKDPFDPDDKVASEDDPRGGGVGDLVRKALLSGLGAVFMTEEQIRKSVQELKLPKEALGYIAGQAERTRTEASKVLRKELRRFLNSDAFRTQISEMLTGLTLEVKAEVRLKPSPTITSARVRVKPPVKADDE